MSQSELNPEAPEFRPAFEATVRSVYQFADKAVRISNTFPSGKSHDYYKTFTDFNVVISKITEGVVSLSNEIMLKELPSIKLKCGEGYNDENTEKVIDANDSLLDRVNINIDTLSGVYKPSDSFLSGVAGSRNYRPVVSTIKLGSTTLIGAKNIPRPQISFKDRIDNSQNPFVPKLQDKPNNIKPLALESIYDDEGKLLGFENPYKTELELYVPPDHALAVVETEMPPPVEQTPLTYVDTEPQLQLLLDHLDQVQDLAVDLEHHSFRSYQGITCLMQITTDSGGDFIVDTLALREHMHKLNQTFTDPKKVKVFHGADADVKWLQRDFGVYVVGMWDTHQAARLLRPAAGLALRDLLRCYCRLHVDKKYQLADWRMRPLPAELLHYARTDTHYLLHIYRRMKCELVDADPSGLKLAAVFHRSRDVCALTYNKRPVDEKSYLQLYQHSRKSFDHRQVAALSSLYVWRDQCARELDESPIYLVPNHMLVTLAEALPRELQGVLACCSPTPPFVREHALTIHRMILACRERAAECAGEEMPAHVRAMCSRAPALPEHALDDVPEHEHEHEHGSALCAGVAWREVARASRYAPAAAFREGARAPPRVRLDKHVLFPPYEQYLMYRAFRQAQELNKRKTPLAPAPASDPAP